MQFRLRTLLLLFVFVWSGMAAFGAYGAAFAAYLLLFIVCVRCHRVGYRAALGWLALLTLVMLGLVCLVIGITPDYRLILKARCQHNLYQIGLGLQNYDSLRKHFPAAYGTDEDGKPKHSWRIDILPFMGYESLWQQYDYDEPWDGPNNSKLADEMPREFACPVDREAGPPYTNYVAVVGPKTVWPGAKCVGTKDIADQLANTIMVVEVTSDQRFHWMEPRDLTWDDIGRGIHPETTPGISSKHDDPSVLCVDGNVHFLPFGQHPETLRALLSIDGGEDIELDKLEVGVYGDDGHRDWPGIIALGIFVGTFILLLRKALAQSTGNDSVKTCELDQEISHPGSEGNANQSDKENNE